MKRDMESEIEFIKTELMVENDQKIENLTAEINYLAE
jgi:hypothetical protein